MQIIRKAKGDFLLQDCTDFFDVVSLFTTRQDPISVRSVTHTDVYKLQRENFESIIKQYPTQAGYIADAVHRHLKPVHASIASKHSALFSHAPCVPVTRRGEPREAFAAAAAVRHADHHPLPLLLAPTRSL